MSFIKIAVLPGDGIGPEVVAQAVKVLNAVAARHKFVVQLEEALIGAVAIDKTGNPLPPETIDLCKNSDAVLLGAVGHPRYDNDPSAKVRPEQGLLGIRKALGLFANIRPVVTYPLLYKASPLRENLLRNVDFVIYRELTGGIYFGSKGRTNNGEEAYDHCVYSRQEIIRIAQMAFENARKRRKHLTLVDKANVLETSRLWRETVRNMASDYPDVQVDYMFVDAASMKIIQNPSFFDVVLTENMFGDILTDEASVITGSIGMLPSASLGESKGLFEPIHGSWPEGAGKNIANPYGTILSVAMMMDYLGFSEAASDIRKSVSVALENRIVTGDIDQYHARSTEEIGDYIANSIGK
ncbi:MAG: 3-isopropylmalate dehydrogenase [Bacteroidales bacterium]|nr:3-isopropylmalate dehydrogenase [Bacteroidales bacterium]HQK36814.1 3-isopropylmalate dehydrogenase [Bacteroidales bacterium]